MMGHRLSASFFVAIGRVRFSEYPTFGQLLGPVNFEADKVGAWEFVRRSGFQGALLGVQRSVFC
jgi:hypothetical protein